MHQNHWPKWLKVCLQCVPAYNEQFLSARYNQLLVVVKRLTLIILRQRNLLVLDEYVVSRTLCTFFYYVMFLSRCLYFRPILYFQGCVYLFRFNGSIRFIISSFDIFFHEWSAHTDGLSNIDWKLRNPRHIHIYVNLDLTFQT